MNKRENKIFDMWDHKPLSSRKNMEKRCIKDIYGRSTYYAMTNKIRLALYNRKSGAQSTTYYGRIKNVYRIVKPNEFKMPRTRKGLEKLKEQGIIEYVPPLSEKRISESYSSSGGLFEWERIRYYEVEAPVLIETIFVYEGKWDYSYELVNDNVNEEITLVYDRPFALVIKEAEVIDNRSGIPIEELQKLNCRRIGTTIDNLYGDDFDEYELENGCKATLFYRRTLTSDVGYRINYTKLLRIYPPPQK
ncbi:MAG: hypothetical protein QW607_09715 [Desulfurococcaceae archaeon]